MIQETATPRRHLIVVERPNVAAKRARVESMKHIEKCDKEFCTDYTRLLVLLIGCSCAANAHLVVADALKEKYTTRDDFALR